MADRTFEPRTFQPRPPRPAPLHRPMLPPLEPLPPLTSSKAERLATLRHTVDSLTEARRRARLDVRI